MNVIHMLIILCFRTVYTWKGRLDLPEPFFFAFFRFYACFFLKKEYTGCCVAAMPRNTGQIWTADNDVMKMRIVALSFFYTMCSRNLFVLDFTRRFFVRCVQIFEAYAVRTLIKFERGWRKISRKSRCGKDSESTSHSRPRCRTSLFTKYGG